MGTVLQQKMASMKEYPNISPGVDFDGYNEGTKE
jgi:hypothetical protein